MNSRTFFDVLNGDTNSATTVNLAGDTGLGATQSLYQSLKTTEKMQAMGGEIVTFTPAQLERVINHLVQMMAHSHFKIRSAAKQAELLDGKELVNPSRSPVDGKQAAREGFDPEVHWASKMEIVWGVYYDIFKSRRMYGANLENLTAVKGLIDQIVKRDRLPIGNSHEAQQSLRHAWNTIDVCIYNAAYYKLCAKATYILCLLLGTLVIFFTVFQPSINGSTIVGFVIVNTTDCDVTEITDNPFFASTLIFMTASLLTVVTGINTFYDPSRRWRELRAVAERMQSDIIAFRTRTGLYNVDRAEPRRPEQRFVQRIKESRVALVPLAGLTESSFSRKYKSNVYRHGQNKSARIDAFQIRKLSEDAPIRIEDGSEGGRIIDNHHSPMCVRYTPTASMSHSLLSFTEMPPAYSSLSIFKRL